MIPAVPSAVLPVAGKDVNLLRLSGSAAGDLIAWTLCSRSDRDAGE